MYYNFFKTPYIMGNAMRLISTMKQEGERGELELLYILLQLNFRHRTRVG